MYHSTIIDRNVGRLYDSTGIQLKRYDLPFIEETIERLEPLVKERDKSGRPSNGDNGPFTRDLTASEWEFIHNERLLCKLDFHHFAKNYGFTFIRKQGDPRDGTVARIKEYLEPQKILVDQIAQREFEINEALLRNEPVDGVLFLLNKARQQAATATGRFATMHRALFWDDVPAVAASVDEEMVHTLYERDHVIYDNLPWWLKPFVGYDAKDTHFSFENLNSSITYFQANQKGGLGTGKTVNTIHLTEVGLWEAQAGVESVKKIQMDLIPAIPQSPRTLVFVESTSNGKNNYWFTLNTESWAGRTRFKVWFCPWYAEPKNSRMQPPEGWQPLDVTKAMMRQVEETSPVYMGYKVTLDPQQAYNWEFKFEEARRQQQLYEFLSNYPTTFEESFQNSGSKAFSIDAMQYINSMVTHGVPYELVG